MVMLERTGIVLFALEVGMTISIIIMVMVITMVMVMETWRWRQRNGVMLMQIMMVK